MSWYVEVRHSVKPRYTKHEQWGSKVTVRIDPDRYAQARLAKVVAQATREGRTLSESVQNRILDKLRAEAVAKSDHQ